MSSQPTNINQYRKSKSRARVLDALEHFQTQAVTYLADEHNSLDLEAFEEFMAQVLGDHLTRQSSAEASDQQNDLAANYRRFNTRLKKRLQTKMKTRQLFAPGHSG